MLRKTTGINKSEIASATTAADKRCAPRDDMRDAGITCFITRPDGTKLEGVARDVSDGGAKISGPHDNLRTGDTVELVLVVLGQQKVRYEAEVRHIDHLEKTIGVRFKSGPTVMEGTSSQATRCSKCRKTFPGDYRFCAYCGQRVSRW